MERRQSNRYQLRAAVVVTWMDATGVEHKAGGSTLNVGPFGVSVRCDGSCPPVGRAVILDVRLPVPQERSLQLKAGGLVLRVEEILGSPAFAAAVTGFEIPDVAETPDFLVDRGVRDAITVRCNGRITSATTPSLKATVTPLFSESKKVVLDLTGVNYVDSSGLGAIIGLFNSAKTANSQLKISHANKRLKKLFSRTKLNHLLVEGA